MVNTWVRPKEWPISSGQPPNPSVSTQLPVQRGGGSTSSNIHTSQSQPSYPQPPNARNGANEPDVGNRKFQMKISGSSTMTKTSGMSGLPGKYYTL